MKPTTPQQIEVCAQAETTIRNINFLLGREEFTAFMERFKRRADELANEILHNDMKPKKREALRNRRQGILEVLSGPTDDRRASNNILVSYGMAVRDQ